MRTLYTLSWGEFIIDHCGHDYNNAELFTCVIQLFIFMCVLHVIFLCVFRYIFAFIYLSGICSTDEIEWNRNGDGVIDFYPLHFLFPASKFCICIFVFTFTPFTSSSLQVGFSSLKGTTSNSHKKKTKTKLGI